MGIGFSSQVFSNHSFLDEQFVPLTPIAQFLHDDGGCVVVRLVVVVLLVVVVRFVVVVVVVVVVVLFGLFGLFGLPLAHFLSRFEEILEQSSSCPRDAAVECLPSSLPICPGPESSL